jgi:exopolysaccharide biosynthesis polyprenyl glycosylphosphotransferase
MPLVAAIDLLTLLGCSWIILVVAGTPGTASVAAWRHLLPADAISVVLVLQALGLYRGWNRRPLADLQISIAASIVARAVIWMLLCRWEPNYAIPGSLIVGMTLLQGIALTSERMLILAIIHRSEIKRRTVVIAADKRDADQVLQTLLASAPPGLSIDACLATEAFNRLLDSEIVWHTILLTREVEGHSAIVRRASALGKRIYFVPGIFELLVNGAPLLNVDDLLMVNLTPPRLNHGQRCLKRAMDIVGAMVLLTLTAPIMVATAILVRLTSPGKALFAQRRVGRDGCEFSVHKFRTMVADAERQTGPVLATANDPRITKIGAFLRATRLDEFPQLFNVLRGEMSLVGPRPERPHFVQQFREQIPGYEFRLAVKPGVTGLAQVYGRYSTTAERKLRFDLTYITKYSLLMDIRLLLSTIAVLLRREQAEGIAVSAGSTAAEAAE